MAIRYEYGETVQTNCGFVKKATIYVTNTDEVERVSTAGLMMGSTLTVVNASAVYMLNADGGEWRSISNKVTEEDRQEIIDEAIATLESSEEVAV